MRGQYTTTQQRHYFSKEPLPTTPDSKRISSKLQYIACSSHIKYTCGFPKKKNCDLKRMTFVKHDSNARGQRWTPGSFVLEQDVVESGVVLLLCLLVNDVIMECLCCTRARWCLFNHVEIIPAVIVMIWLNADESILFPYHSSKIIRNTVANLKR